MTQWILTHYFRRMIFDAFIWGWFLTHFCMIFDAFLACQMTQFTLDDTLCRLIFQVHFFAPIEHPPDLEHLYWWAPYLDLEHPILIWITLFWFQTSILILNTFFNEKLHKMKLRILNLIIPLKLELSPQNVHNEPLLCILSGSHLLFVSEFFRKS